MATIDEYIVDFLSTIETYDDPRSLRPTADSSQIPPAAFVTDPNIVSIVQKSTVEGEKSVIPLVDSVRGQILESTNLRNDDESLQQVLAANLSGTGSVVSTQASQTEIDSRGEAFVPSSPETPQQASIIQFGTVPETLPITEIIPDLSQESQTEQTTFALVTNQQEREEAVNSVQLKVSVTEDVSQAVPPETQAILQEFFVAFADAQEQSTSNLEAIAAETERTVETFVFNPGISLFAAADSVALSAEQAFRQQQQIISQVEDITGVSLDSFSSTESLSSIGG